MNSEQLQDWLAELGDTFKATKKKTEAGYRKTLNEHAQNLQVLISYLHCNYEDHRLIQPVLAQLLALYYRLGIARCFTLQVVPSLIGAYLFGLAKRQKNNVSTLETFFLAVYNEEILAGGVGSPTMQKKVEEVRIPSIRCPSIYHDPNKLLPYPEVTQLKLNAPPSVQVRSSRAQLSFGQGKTWS
ncbi:Hyccin [Aphelenchoides avenae]|nr:Hyccin [Aphelenchus avenae]